jgi:hypothetical protein
MNSCPRCQTKSLSQWAKFFAVWPFSTRCKNCGARLRAKIPYWQNVAAQVLAQIVFWTILIVGIGKGAGGIAIGAIVGAALGMLIAMIPGRFAKLEETKK